MNNTDESHPQPTRKQRTIILASTSKYRKQLLERLRIQFQTVAPNIDESPAKHCTKDPISLARNLAIEKTRAVSKTHPHNIIIGCDQCAAFDNQILGKPHTTEGAIAQLTKLSGHTHMLVTAMCVHDPTTDRQESVVDIHQMTMRHLTHEQIRRYVELDQPLDCAGSYKLESLGIALFDRVAGDDHTAIIGLPLMQLVSMLAVVGFDVLANADVGMRGVQL